VSLKSGSTVLHYRIERHLGTGGMGEVYLAHDTKLHRSVAIKFLSTPDDSRARQRLLREARAAAGLDHPGVCAVYDVGTDPIRGDFVVMQYVEGETLSDRLRRGRLEPTEALRLAERVAEALVSAHDRGVIHRDLKPQNIIITPSGRPKLLDFGLAKRALTGAAAAEARTTAALTGPHAIVGTPGYMAPEQIRNGVVDRRADVFALGCVLYECLTGRRAFPGPTTPDILGQVLQTDPPPVSTVVPGIGAGFDSLCTRLLAKDVKERCQSAEEALGAIRALLPAGTPVSTDSRPPTQSSSSRWIRQHRRVAGGAAIALVAATVAGIGVVRWRHRHPFPDPSPAAEKWYDRGVSAIREGAYAGARASLDEAIRLDPQYVQAYARLADARSELDDQRGAQAALLRVDELVPDRTGLSAGDRLRLDAVIASVLRDHDRAIAAYTALANDRPADAAGWLDLGRAQEAAFRLADAKASYTKALQLDGQYAAAYARLGFMQGTGTPAPTAIGQLDEAIRLYRIAADLEGEAEVDLRKGVLLTAVGQYDAARQALEHVVSMTTDPRYAAQRLRAQFELARVMARGGRFKDAEELGTKAVDEANAAAWQGIAANGLIDLAGTLILARQYDDADALFVRARSVASAQGATRTEMRAQASQASLRQVTGKPQEAVALCEAPLKFFSEGHYTRFEAETKGVLARADGDLERYEEGSALAAEVLRAAEAAGNDGLVATSLETLAGQLAALGRLPEALADRTRIVQLHRTQKDVAILPYDLTNRAELLIRLGRGAEARQALDEVDQGIKAGIESYKARRLRVALVRALLGTVERRFQDVIAANLIPTTWTASSPDAGTLLYTRLLVEHARAAIGQSKESTAAIAAWLDQADSPEFRRQLTFWVADTLLARGDRERAYALATAALAGPGGQQNIELRWRLEAVAGLAGRTGTANGGASISSQARADLQRLSDVWLSDAPAYLARPDLTELRRTVH
jgi:tetratricopeptide (TPR) repeat protein/predicted Ser/Thr protein kinase